MNIAIIGTGNVGGALATAWSKAGHTIYLGVRDPKNFKGQHLLQNESTTVGSIKEAVASSQVVLLATPSPLAVEVAQSLGDTQGKVIIDSMNVVMGRGPAGYTNTAQAILDNTATDAIAKCFNTTGYNNMVNPEYGDTRLDLFTCGHPEAKKVAQQLARDAGFENCYDCGGNEHFELMEKFAFFWINLAMMQGQGREIGFKLLKR